MIEITRETLETSVAVRLALGQPAGSGPIDTSDAALDHMLVTLARFAGLNLAVTADGDLRHHVIEDVAISLGLALRDSVPATCQRYGHAVVPMDDALVEATIDAGGRAYYQGRLPSTLYDHFFRTLAENARMTIHLRVLRGRDRHHIIEAAFKAAGFCLRQALASGAAVFSTKGAVRVERKAGDVVAPGPAGQLEV